jgi:hypothetical protein
MDPLRHKCEGEGNVCACVATALSARQLLNPKHFVEYALVLHTAKHAPCMRRMQPTLLCILQRGEKLLLLRLNIPPLCLTGGNHIA